MCVCVCVCTPILFCVNEMKFGMKRLPKKLLLQSQFTMADILVLLDELYLMRIFNFLCKFWKHCS